jgi:biopolymer transport protein ExbD/biopolymer transport protein TolR
MSLRSPEGRITTSLAEINVTPLVDVVLVLLVIFMVTAPILQTGIQVSLPKTQKVTSGRPSSEAIVITIDKDSNVYLGSGRMASTKPIRALDLPKLLEARLARSTDRKVYVRGDGEVPYRTIAYILSLCKKSGATVSLVTDVEGPVKMNRS